MVEISSTIQCKSRGDFGKGAARKLRAAGLAPAIAYGPGREALNLALDQKMFKLQRRSYGRSHIYDVDVEGEGSFKALIKDVQIDPLSREIVHVDFYAVDMSKPIRVEVVIEMLGKPLGAVEGGLLSQVMRHVDVQCLPDQIPSKLTVDVSGLNIGGVVHTNALELPAGVTLTLRRDEPVATVVAPEAEEEPTPDAALEGLEGVEGEALPEGEEGEAAAAAPEGEAGEEKDDKGKKEKKEKKGKKEKKEKK